MGPLTNIAIAIQKEPRILETIPEIVIMGGAHDHGNRSPSAEFNVWLDPEAARIVVNCGRPIRMVPLDATHRALVSTEDCRRASRPGTPAGEAAARFISKRIDGYDATQPMHRAGAAPVHDALAVCAVIDPSILTTRVHPGGRGDRRRAVRRADGVRLPVPQPASLRTCTSRSTRTSRSSSRMLLDILGRTA